MRTEEYHASRLVELLETERILALDRVADALGRPSRMTVFRKLAQLGGRASYSHHGRYHTLDRIAEYDRNGLWSYHAVRFSRQGTLLRTILHLVEDSAQGYFASELQALVQVRVHNPLAHLYGAQLLVREQIGDQYLYVSPTGGKKQLEERYDAIQQAHEEESRGIQEISGDLAESMCLLLSALNEKQRRLYLGLESIRLGHGGDAKISLVTGVNVKTIARGRQELQAHNVTTEHVRDVGGGRPSFKKKRRDGTPERTDESGHGRRSDE